MSQMPDSWADTYKQVKTKYPELYRKAVQIGSTAFFNRHNDLERTAAQLEYSVMSLILQIMESKMTKIPRGLKKCHHPNLDSVVLTYEPFLTRAFIATGSTGERTVAAHTHRTSLKIRVLAGRLTHYTQTLWSGKQTGVLYQYMSPLLGGGGLAKSGTKVNYTEIEQVMQTGDTLCLPHTEFHTVSWARDAIWLVEEGPVMKDVTQVLLRKGDSFDTTGLYEPMSERELKERLDFVWRLKP